MDYLSNVYSFKLIETDQCSNVLCDKIEWTRPQHMWCQQLLYSTILCNDKRPDVNNLIIKVTCYNKNGVSIIGFVNVLVKLNLSIILYIERI